MGKISSMVVSCRYNLKKLVKLAPESILAETATTVLIFMSSSFCAFRGCFLRMIFSFCGKCRMCPFFAMIVTSAKSYKQCRLFLHSEDKIASIPVYAAFVFGSQRSIFHQEFRMNHQLSPSWLSLFHPFQLSLFHFPVPTNVGGWHSITGTK